MHDGHLLFVFLGLGAVSKNSFPVESFANIWQIKRVVIITIKVGATHLDIHFLRDVLAAVTVVAA